MTQQLEPLVEALATTLGNSPCRLPSPPFSSGCRRCDQAVSELRAALAYLEQGLGRNKNVTDLQYAAERVEQMYAILAAQRR
ncbi:MAG: hypothetical protein II007_13840 [Gammaproteobacteria bacterium]|nr:hypothetical protein [Gammaproteobacteria bacterium]